MVVSVRNWRASGIRPGAHGTCSANIPEEVFVVSTVRASFTLFAALALLGGVPAFCQVAGESMIPVPNQGTLEGSANRAPEIPVAEPVPLDASQPQTNDVPRADTAVASDAEPDNLPESAAAGRKIPQAERDAFRAQWGLDTDRQTMRAWMREAARKRLGTTERYRRSAPCRVWPEWRFYRHDSLDRLPHWPAPKTPERRGHRAERRWRFDLPDSGVRAPGVTPPWNLPLDRPEYDGPWPWEQDPAGTPPADPDTREDVRTL